MKNPQSTSQLRQINVFRAVFLLALSAFLAAYLLPLSLSAEQDTGQFITTWDMAFSGESSNTTLNLPIQGGGSGQYTVDWGDEQQTTEDASSTSFAKHEYAAPGVYQVKISGDFPGLKLAAGTEDTAAMLVSVDQWGDAAWNSFNGAFTGAGNLKTLPSSAPDISVVSDFSNAFSGAAQLDYDFSGWNFAGANEMSGFLDNSGLSWQSYDSFISNFKTTFMSGQNGGVNVGAAGLEFCGSSTERYGLELERGVQFVNDFFNREKCYPFNIRYDFNNQVNIKVSENTAANTPITTILLDDNDSDSAAVSLDMFCSQKADGGYFMVNDQRQLILTAMMDYEDPKSDQLASNEYSICVRATDPDGHETEQILSISIVDVPEGGAVLGDSTDESNAGNGSGSGNSLVETGRNIFLASVFGGGIIVLGWMSLRAARLQRKSEEARVYRRNSR